MYKVVKFFKDLKDGGHAYKVGDVFPREGAEASEARIAELSSNKNRQGTPLIEVVPQPIEKKEVIADEVKPKKRGTRKKN